MAATLLAVANGSVFKLRNRTLPGFFLPFLLRHVGHDLTSAPVAGEEMSWRFGMVTGQEQPQISFLYAPGDQALYPTVFSRLTFRVAPEVLKRGTPRIDVLVYHSQEKFRLGVDRLGKKQMCCTSEMVDRNQCSKRGEILMQGQIIGSEADGSFRLYPVFLNQTTVVFEKNLETKITGVYYYFLANCGTEQVTVDGRVVFVNPFGFLGVTEFPSLVFYSMATWIYVFAVMVFFMLCVVHYKELFHLQIFIGVLFLVGFAEMALWYGEFSYANVTGTSSLFLVVTGVLTSTIKRTLSRTLVLVTAMGLGIMIARLENGQRVKIALLTVALGISSFVFDLMQVFERNQASAQKLSLIFLMLVAVFDVIFYYWTFLSLSVLLKQLATRRNKTALSKFLLYKQLWWILVLTAVFSAALIVTQVVLVSLDKADSAWMMLWWLRFAAWDIGYFMLLLSVAYLFRPMDNNQRFAVTADVEMDKMSDAAEIASSLPMGVDLILEDAGELDNVQTQMKQH